MGLQYRILPPEEWFKLIPLMRRTFGDNHMLPAPEQAAAAVAENAEGEIVGAQFIQLVFHAEPLCILPEHVGKVNILRLASTLRDALLDSIIAPGGELPYYVLAAKDSNQARMAQLIGLNELPLGVYIGVIRADQEIESESESEIESASL